MIETLSLHYSSPERVVDAYVEEESEPYERGRVFTFDDHALTVLIDEWLPL
ncbi:hypothetical protein [Alkalicoccus luteus]|uniref:hypothetical protein n=1 Tax=Alkalicoccus luteus TaxID=1237094 RepID=UPI0040333E19